MNRLVALIEKTRSESQSIAVVVKRELKTIDDAREAGITWSKISDAVGFPEKWREVQRAYSREKQRQKIKGVLPETRKEVAKEKDEEQKESVPAKEKVEAVKRKIPRIDLEKKDREPNLFERMKLY